MSKFTDKVLKVLKIEADHAVCFDLLTKATTLLSTVPVARMSQDALRKTLANTGVGGVLVADQCIMEQDVTRAHYVTCLKRKDQPVTVRTGLATRLDLFRMDSGIYTKLTNSSDLYKAMSTPTARKGAIVSVTRPEAPYEITSTNDAVAVMAGIFDRVIGHSYTPKIVLTTNTGDVLGELYAKRTKEGLLDWNATVEFITHNEHLSRELMEYGNILGVTGVSLRMSNLSVQSFLSKLTQVRPGAEAGQNSRVEKFFKESFTSSGQPLYGPGMIVSQKSPGREYVDFATRYQQLGVGSVLHRQTWAERKNAIL